MLSTKQKEYLQHCNHRWNIKVGATGSGKSWIDFAVVIPKRILACRGEGAAVLLGNTRGTLCRNIIDPMREIWGEACVSNLHGDSTIDLFGRKVHVLGADNRKHVARIQGMTIEYAYGDEMTTWVQDVFEMLKSRLRCKHSYFDGTCNPDNPQHFMKKFLNSDADIYCQTSTIDDNPFLPPEFVQALKQEYAGTVYYDRFILGQWAAAEGIIYRIFADSIAAKDNHFLWPSDKTLKPWKVSIGVDFGGNGSKHAFVAVGALAGYRGCIALASRRIEPDDITNLVREFLLFAETIFSRWGEIAAVYCDSAEQTIIKEFRSALRRTRFTWLADRIHNSKKRPINDRIRLVSILMGGGRFWYLPEAASLKDALATALWDSKHTGEDKRLDDGTTDIDSLDAFEYSIERDMDYYLRM